MSKNSNTAITPDIDHARQFLELLDSDADSFTFQIIPERDGTIVTPKIIHGALDKNANELISANRSGAGIFVMVNAGDKKGRSAKNVTRIRARFVDLDTSGIDPLFTVELTPHIVVESSPGKWHAYWLADEGASLDEFSTVQRALAERFSGDTAVIDLPRVMRLPGFYHQKKDQVPFMTRMQRGIGD